MLWLIGAALTFGLVAGLIAKAQGSGPLTPAEWDATREAAVLVPAPYSKGEPIDLVPMDTKPWRPMTMRGRIVLSCAVAFGVCIAMAYVAGRVPPREYTELAPRYELGCRPGDYTGPTAPDWCMVPVTREAPPLPGTPVEPNLAWFYLAIWPGIIGLFTALGSWIATGRGW